MSRDRSWRQSMHTCTIIFVNAKVAIRDRNIPKLFFFYKFFKQRATLCCLFCCNLYFIYEQIIDAKCSPFRLLFYLFVNVLIILLRRDYFSRPWRSSGTFVRCPFWRWFTRKVHKSMEVRMNKTWIILNNFPSTGRFCFKLDDLQFMLSFCIVFFYFTLRKER